MKFDVTVRRDADKAAAQLIQPATFAAINRVLATISLVVGSIFIVGTAWYVHRWHLDEFIFKRATTQAVVVENQRVEIAGRSGNDYMGHTSYRAVVRFTAQNGRVVTVPDNMSFSPASFFVGQTVNVFYDPEDPQLMMIDRGWKNFLPPGIPGIMGFLMILGGVQRLNKARQLAGMAPAEAQPAPPPVV